MIKVYIAGPYTKGDVALNVRDALRLADYLANKPSVLPYVPHLTHFWHMNFPRPYEFWLAYDIEWMRMCDAVVRLSGESNGADKEVAQAKDWHMPIFEFAAFSIQELNRLDVFMAELGK